MIGDLPLQADVAITSLLQSFRDPVQLLIARLQPVKGQKIGQKNGPRPHIQRPVLIVGPNLGEQVISLNRQVDEIQPLPVWIGMRP